MSTTLVIPGGQINPDLLRQDEDAVALVRDFYASKKPSCGDLPRTLGVHQGRHRQWPTDDLVSFHGN
jgi:hypothetical protein